MRDFLDASVTDGSLNFFGPATGCVYFAVGQDPNVLAQDQWDMGEAGTLEDT